ncbi:MAG TPA: TetR/AcrR family transcriptional regulator [Myxococcota bacterium]|jgi:AcrR family transcriptional regulator|nr:TetR/AcrR family transcriptional regulator [Myxococcota bacterium]
MQTETRAKDTAGKREAILDAALELFAERGFHGTPVPLVAERAGVGAGTIYRYFESKEALVNALYQSWKTKLGAALMEDFPFDRPVREQFHVYWERMVRFVRQHPRAFAFLELHHHAPYLDDTSRAIEAQLLQVASDFLEQTAKQQVTKALPPALLMAIVFGAFAQLIKASWLSEITLTDEIMDAAEACCWEAIRR